MYVGLVVAVTLVALVTTTATEGGDPAGEDAVELAAFAPPAAPRHDPATAVVLDGLRRGGGGGAEVVGWATQTDRVEVLADGDVIASLPIDQERPDVALAHGLGTAFVGFRGRVDIPPDADLVCVTRPGQLPAPNACDREILELPRHRVVAFYGVPGVPALGTLGDGSPASVRRRLVDQARPYVTEDRPVMHAFEVLGTVAQASAGADGNYSAPIDHADIWRYLEEIRKVDGVLVIDLQPGRETYMDQLPAFDALLREPDVHVALDPEWDMGPNEVPGRVVGQSDASEINAVMDYLDRIIVEERLPKKAVVAHNFQPRMITNRDRLAPPETIDLVVHMDGHGPPATKIGNYGRLVALQESFTGFKLFYQRDVPLLGPRDVLGLEPAIDFVSYQ